MVAPFGQLHFLSGLFSDLIYKLSLFYYVYFIFVDCSVEAKHLFVGQLSTFVFN